MTPSFALLFHNIRHSFSILNYSDLKSLIQSSPFVCSKKRCFGQRLGRNIFPTLQLSWPGTSVSSPNCFHRLKASFLVFAFLLWSLALVLVLCVFVLFCFLGYAVTWLSLPINRKKNVVKNDPTSSNVIVRWI